MTAMRKIIHCDADCFYAAIEMRDDPRLRDIPLAVGGDPSRRGVISTCNYLARQYGVHSAMPAAYAKRLCPGLTIVPHSMEKYRAAAQAMRNVFLHYTDAVEPLSLDEAYLDVSESTLCQGSATRMAQAIRQKIHADIGITVSAGVANSKFLAKIASDWRKPDGLTVITPDQVSNFVGQLPVAKLHGVGKVMTEKLHRLNIHYCGDLHAIPLAELTRHFGVMGVRLYELCRGIDQREVIAERERKSLSVERTFAEDIVDDKACLQQLPALFQQLNGRLHQRSLGESVAKAFVKIKFSDFATTTLERAGKTARISDYRELIQEAVKRSQLPVRLMGIGVRLLPFASPGNMQQLPLL